MSSPLPNPLANAANESTTMCNSAGGESSFLATAINNTATALTGAAINEVKRRIESRTEWTGIGVEWIRSMLGKKEWRVPCVDVLIRL